MYRNFSNIKPKFYCVCSRQKIFNGVVFQFHFDWGDRKNGFGLKGNLESCNSSVEEVIKCEKKNGNLISERKFDLYE